MLEHPEIGWIERTGYPSWMQENDDLCDEDEDLLDDDDCETCGDGYEDWLYDQRRDRELFGDC